MSGLGSSPRPGFIRVALALLAIVLAYALALASLNGISDVYARPAKNFLQGTRDAGQTLTEIEWRAIDANLRRALRLVPNNPVTLTELGRLQRIRMEDDTLERYELERHGNLEIAYFEHAARLRPAWPWVWSSLALARYELNQDSDNAYHEALMHASYFGPWEDAVQLLVAELGNDTWPSLDSSAKQAVLGAIDRALERQPAKLSVVIEPMEAWERPCQEAIAAAAGEFLRLRRYCNEQAFN